MWDETVARHPDRDGVDFFGRRWSYRQLDKSVRKAAAGLRKAGVHAGDRVGLCLPNTPYYVILYLATLKLGAVVVNLNPLYSRYELEKLIADSGARILAVADMPAVMENVAAMVEGGALDTVIVCPMAQAMPLLLSLAYRLFRKKDQAAIPGGASWMSFGRLLATAGEAPTPPIHRDDPAVFQYTGGTTGLPKAAVLTHGNLVSNSFQTAVVSLADPGKCDRVMGVLPLFHVFALTTVLNTSLMMASLMVLLPRYEQKQFVKAVNRTRPTRLFGVPTLFQSLNSLSEDVFPDFRDLELCVSGGAPLPEPVRTAFEKRARCRLVEGYGLSEASPTITCNPADGSGKDGSAGLAYPDTIIEVRSLEDPANVLGIGQTGEVCVRGPQVMKGYWNRPEESGQTFIDGALRTGDVGYLDEDGYLFLVDRIKDVILCGGYNVYPRVIEDALYEHPAVEETLVIGLPDDYRGESPKAFVVLKNGASDTGTAELFAHLKNRISKIEVPKAIEIRTSLPKTKIGKLSRADLKREILG
ncbi:MAG: long-chain fatty acid--CoA ligase [Alphaproteobacteria bacterium]|nr:MAG: long-chain fatty acid--CoA ligase [Alphaproteobacteria bacterium]